ncbi:MAG: PRC-barrel domain-containing protein [Fuerstiella sp.]
MSRLLSISICLALVSSTSAVADDGAAEPFQNVVPASELVNLKMLTMDGVDIGTVSDIVIDREYGQIAFFAVRSKRSTNVLGNAYFLPASSVSLSSNAGRLTCNSTFEDVEHYGDLTKSGPMPLINTAVMSKLYSHYEAKPYWDTSVKVDQQLSLITVDELDGRIVRDSDWHVIARVKELLVEATGNWRVAYLSLGALPDAKTNQRIAVPMAAFAQETLSPTWLLDVPESALLLKQTFKRGDWPTEVNPGWNEFVHVKYGTSTAAGLQDAGTKTN